MKFYPMKEYLYEIYPLFITTFSFQESICEWATTSSVDANLEKYGRLLRDGELRVKAHDDQKVKVR